MIIFGFWLSVFFIFFSYLLYPLLLGVLAKNKKQDYPAFSADELPFVSIVMAAFNEEKVIGQKLKSIFDSDLPAEHYEILIGSDNSDDRTASIVKSFQKDHPNIIFHNYRERRGKQNVVNDLVKEAQGEILILTDANVIFDKNTIFELVKYFKNSSIGLVDSNMVNMGLKEDGISYQEQAYISREVGIKYKEGVLWGAMMGPFGGCYAIRKENYREVPPNTLVDDFYINMTIFEQGLKAINNVNAKVFDEIPNDLSVEFRRKIRIGTGNFQNLARFWHLLFKAPYGFPFLAHKVLRWFGPFILIKAFLFNLWLIPVCKIYVLIFFIQMIVYMIPLADFFLKRLGIHNRVFRLITHFLAMNLALFIGFFKSLTRVKSGVWERTAR